MLKEQTLLLPSLDSRRGEQKEEGIRRLHMQQFDSDSLLLHTLDVRDNTCRKKAKCTGGGETQTCADLYLNDKLTCVCNLPASNEKYCTQWSCRDTSSNGYSEKEDYRCLEEDVTGEYCYSWGGNISSSYEIESSVCQCREREESYCHHWECRERSLTRCASHFGGWCTLEYGIGIGGGIGLVFLLCCGHYLLNGDCTDTEVDILPCLTCSDSVLNSDWFLRCASHFGCQGASDCLQFGKFLKAVIVFCLSWLSGVLIWGGIDALIVVLVVWFFVFFEILRLYIAQLRRERTQMQLFDAP